MKNMDTLRLIQAALKEDIGNGDHTSNAIFPENTKGEAFIKTKQKGVVCGIDVATMVFKEVDADLRIEKLLNDGDGVESGDEVMYIEGSIRSILTAERTALNFLQRLSGIATYTNTFVQAIEGYKAKILDTRKTTPAWRMLEKYAVEKGGGQNHRMGLYDMILIKDNHIDFCGGVQQAIQLAQNYLKENAPDIPVVVEARSLDDVRLILQNKGVHRILLDNFDTDTAAQAVKWCQGKTLTEISGNVNIENIRAHASTGVDFISIGAITHSFNSFDFTLLAKLK